MRPQLDCLICFLHQGLKTARSLMPDAPEKHEELLRAWSAELSKLDFTETPPQWAAHLYPMATEILETEDLFAQAKKEANQRVLEILPELRSTVLRDKNPMRTALNVSIIGNYIDNGPPQMFDWETALTKERNTEFLNGTVERFTSLLQPGAKLLILGDNAGEIGLDTILVEMLRQHKVQTTYAVRSVPVLNDATLEDARIVGMDKLCKVIPSGSTAPGTILSQGTPEFLDAYYNADIVLSKGQGNFESLHDRARRSIFFAFKAKCSVVCDQLDRPLGSSMFMLQES